MVKNKIVEMLYNLLEMEGLEEWEEWDLRCILANQEVKARTEYLWKNYEKLYPLQAKEYMKKKPRRIDFCLQEFADRMKFNIGVVIDAFQTLKQDKFPGYPTITVTKEGIK